jgi:hypothetical protein
MDSWFFLSFPRYIDFCGAGPEKAKNPSGAKVLRMIQIRLAMLSLAKISATCQTNSWQARIANSNSTNAVSFSSVRTPKRFPSPRCASESRSFAFRNPRLSRSPNSNRLC